MTDKLIRIEYGQSDFYTDLPTQMVWFRDFPKVEFQIIENTQSILIETNRVILSCQNSGQSLEDVLIVCKGKTEKDFCWRFGDEVETLKGTVRTLDLVDGQTPLEEGILSRKGCSVLDDSKSYLIREDGELQQRSGEETDIYFFGYGHDYKECLKDYFKLTGSSPLLPRYALGNWWSRYHRYLDYEYLDLMNKFEEKNTMCDRNPELASANMQQNRSGNLRKNTHPTVKPCNLMQYLVRLVTPNNGIVLDPFNGSGSTGKAVMYENKERNKGYKYIGIELTEEYLPIAKARIEYVCGESIQQTLDLSDLD